MIGNFSASKGNSKAIRQEEFQEYACAVAEGRLLKAQPCYSWRLNGEPTFAEELRFTGYEGMTWK